MVWLSTRFRISLFLMFLWIIVSDIKDYNVGIAIINHPPNHYKWVVCSPSKMGGLWDCYTHISMGTGGGIVLQRSATEVKNLNMVSFSSALICWTSCSTGPGWWVGGLVGWLGESQEAKHETFPFFLAGDLNFSSPFLGLPWPLYSVGSERKFAHVVKHIWHIKKNLPGIDWWDISPPKKILHGMSVFGSCLACRSATDAPQAPGGAVQVETHSIPCGHRVLEVLAHEIPGGTDG